MTIVDAESMEEGVMEAVPDQTVMVEDEREPVMLSVDEL